MFSYSTSSLVILLNENIKIIRNVTKR